MTLHTSYFKKEFDYLLFKYILKEYSNINFVYMFTFKRGVEDSKTRKLIKRVKTLVNSKLVLALATIVSFTFHVYILTFTQTLSPPSFPLKEANSTLPSFHFPVKAFTNPLQIGKHCMFSWQNYLHHRHCYNA